MENPKENSTENNYFTQPPFEIQKPVTIKMNKLEKISYILALSSIIISVLFALTATFDKNTNAFQDIFRYSLYILLLSTVLTIGLGFYEFFSIKRLKDLNSDKRIAVYGVRFGLIIIGMIVGTLISIYLYKVISANASAQNTTGCGADFGCHLAPVFVGSLYIIIADFLVMINTVYIFSCFIADKIFVYFLNRKIE